MAPSQSLLRSPQRMVLQIRSSSANRSLLQRRFAHIEGPQLTGAADNAFNRERQAVKAHAAATSGETLQRRTLITFGTDDEQIPGESYLSSMLPKPKLL